MTTNSDKGNISSSSSNNGNKQNTADRYLVSIVEESLVSSLDASSSPLSSSPVSSSSSSRIVRLEDPNDEGLRSYMIIPTYNDAPSSSTTTTSTTGRGAGCRHTICEIQRIAVSKNEYNAFLIRGHVIGKDLDGNSLYTITPIDPLFWILSAASRCCGLTESTNQQQQQRQQWQPLEQILSAYFDHHHDQQQQQKQGSMIRDAIDEKQLLHVLDRIDIGEEEYVYKFSEMKALKWLQQKQQSVESVLLIHEKHTAQQEAIAKRKIQQQQKERMKHGGAFSSTFHLPTPADETKKHKDSANVQEEETENQNPADTTSVEKRLNSTTADDSGNPKSSNVALLSPSSVDVDNVNTTRAREESIQIVCHYLNEYWTERFIQHLNVTNEVLQAKKKNETNNNKRKWNGNDNGAVDTNKKNQLPAITHDWNETLQQPVISMPPDNTNGNSTLMTNAMYTSTSKKLKPDPKNASHGAKILAKVNTKGMKKMTSFFTAKTKS